MSTAGNQSIGQTRDTAGEDLRRKAANVKQDVQDLGAAAKAAATEKMGELRDSASEYYEMGRERVYDYEQSIEEYIRDQPLKSVLIATGVGFLFGLCYMRR